MAAGAGAAEAAVIRVPADAPTVQAAVDKASDGDVIRIAAGHYCGATIDRDVQLVGSPGTTIIGCAQPSEPGGLRIGFLLVDDRASGSSIRGFRFDGVGAGENNLTPVALAILGRGAHGVIVRDNRIDGTVQGITNTGGDGWFIAGNTIKDVTLFGCDGGSRCGGGVGIVVQQRDVTADRAFGNVVLLNDVSGHIPDGQALVGLSAVFVLGQDLPVVALNRLSVPHNANATVDGDGVDVTDVCCGDPSGLLTTTRAVIVGNDGRGSEIAVQVDRDASGGTGNSVGAFIRNNLGVVIVDGAVVSQVVRQAAAAGTARTATHVAPMPFL